MPIIGNPDAESIVALGIILLALILIANMGRGGGKK
jgi:hypothetical protein